MEHIRLFEITRYDDGSTLADIVGAPVFRGGKLICTFNHMAEVDAYFRNNYPYLLVYASDEDSIFPTIKEKPYDGPGNAWGGFFTANSAEKYMQKYHK